MKVIELDQIDSTNSYLERNAADMAEDMLVIAKEQTAGKGQRGNSWESEPGKNLTFSLLHHPSDLVANKQFHLSEAVALAVVDFLAQHGIEAKVKWPNDIYVGDKKICGILIKHSLMGSRIEYSIIGAGINVNQEDFLSDAPNPVSMKNLTGKEYDLEVMLGQMRECLERRLESISIGDGQAGVHEEFKARLWRGDREMYPFRDAATGETFQARIKDVHPQGFLHLADDDARERSYAFKEVIFIL